MLVVDSSALVKRYLPEPGRAIVLREMARDERWCASSLCLAETHITLCRMLDDPVPSQERLDAEWRHFVILALDDSCLHRAMRIGCAWLVSTADAIHLGAAARIGEPFRFLTFDRRQAVAARSLGFDLVDVDAA